MAGLDHRDTVTDFTLPEGTFFDVAMVHLLTTATLDRLRELYPQGRFEVRRFRPNIVVQLASGEKGFAENAWVGRTLAIGTAVRLSITGPCGRCVMTTLAQGDLPKDPGILRTASGVGRVRTHCSVSASRRTTGGRSCRWIRKYWRKNCQLKKLWCESIPDRPISLSGGCYETSPLSQEEKGQ